MSLNWQWKERVGYLVTDDQEEIRKTWKNYRINLYRGNAPLIAISEWENEKGNMMYQPFSFFCDEDHAKRCLGLAKDSDYIMFGVKEIHLDVNLDKDMEKIVKLWMKAIVKYDLDVTIILERLYSDINM